MSPIFPRITAKLHYLWRISWNFEKGKAFYIDSHNKSHNNLPQPNQNIPGQENLKLRKITPRPSYGQGQSTTFGFRTSERKNKRTGGMIVIFEGSSMNQTLSLGKYSKWRILKVNNINIQNERNLDDILEDIPYNEEIILTLSAPKGRRKPLRGGRKNK